MTKSTIGRLVAALTIAGAATLFAANSRVEWIATPKNAYIVMPPALITDGTVERSVWAPNGAYILVAATPSIGPTIDQILSYTPSRAGDLSAAPKTGPALIVWDRAKQQVRKLWSTDDASVQIIDIEWLKDSSTAYITMAAESVANEKVDTYCGVMSLDVDSGKFSWVPGLEHLSRFPTICASPLRPTAVIAFDDKQIPPRPLIEARQPVAQQIDVAVAAGSPGSVALKLPSTAPAGEYIGEGVNNFWTVVPGGKVVQRVAAPPLAGYGIVWGKDGSKWYLGQRDRKTKAVTVQEFDGAGKLNQVTADLYAAPKEPKPELLVTTKPMTAKLRKVRRGFNNLWLSSPEATFHPDVLVTPNGVDPEFAPTQDAVFYVESGIAKVRALVALTDDQKKGLYEALKVQAISDAKQVGLGLLMYSSDYDDVLPSGDAFDGVDPYLKNRDMMDGFTYTPPGSLSTGSMQNPAGTPLGYVDGPGGRATVWGDGHVTWGANP